MNVLRCFAAALVAALASQASATGQDFPRGEILDNVKSLTDPSQGYALYVPTTYSRDRAWPVLVGFHPAARGRAIVEKYRAAAERYGYIVAASNNSRNGSWEVSGRAAQAVTQDVAARFSVHGARIYLTGHSGGARVAMQIALTNKAIAGVIASSAGYPDAQPRSSVRFPIFGTAGTNDFNYIEMRQLDNALKSPHRVVIFEGGHTLPPDDVAMQAIEWLDLQAMKAGTRQQEPALIDRWLAERMAAADAAGESMQAIRLFREIADDFAGLRDVKVAGARAAALARQPAIKRALDRDRDDVRAEAILLQEFSLLEAGLGNQQTRNDSLASLRALLADTHKKATSPADSAVRDRSRRVLRIITMGASERVTDRDYLALLQKYL